MLPSLQRAATTSITTRAASSPVSPSSDAWSSPRPSCLGPPDIAAWPDALIAQRTPVSRGRIAQDTSPISRTMPI